MESFIFLSRNTRYSAHFERGVVWKNKGMLDEAIVDLTTALEIYPDYWMALTGDADQAHFVNQPTIC